MPFTAETDTRTATAAEVHRIAVRMPPFILSDPALWFAMAERSFFTTGVTVEDTKFGHVLGFLDPQYAREVKDIIMSPPADRPFTRLKEELIKRLGLSQEANTRQLLEREEIGDRKPSQFLRQFRDLVGDAVSDSVLRTLWTGRLPQTVQAILATQKDVDLNKVAELADTVVEATRPVVHVNELQNGGAQKAAATASLAQFTLGLQEELRAIRQEVNSLRGRQQGRTQRRDRSKSRTRARSESEPPADTCWYHHRYGSKARKCKGDGCKFAGNARAGN